MLVTAIVHSITMRIRHEIERHMLVRDARIKRRQYMESLAAEQADELENNSTVAPDHGPLAFDSEAVDSSVEITAQAA